MIITHFMAVIGAPKTPADAESATRDLQAGELKDLEGVQGMIENLRKGDWAAFAGGILALLTQYFGSPKEKAEAVKAGREAKTEQAEQRTEGRLDTLRESVERKRMVELVKNPELGDGGDIAIIGDSAAQGMHMSFAPGKQPTFIGKVGFTTMQVLERLEAERGRLKGKKKAVIYCAGNNILNPTKNIVSDLVRIAKICREEGVPEIIVNTQFPPIPKHKEKVGAKRLKEIKDANEALRVALLKESGFPAGVRVVDLTTPFSDENGEMKAEFVNPKEEDTLHPWLAYKPALAYMGAQGEGAKAA